MQRDYSAALGHAANDNLKSAMQFAMLSSVPLQKCINCIQGAFGRAFPEVKLIVVQNHQSAGTQHPPCQQAIDHYVVSRMVAVDIGEIKPRAVLG